MLKEPLGEAAAKSLIRQILAVGSVVWSRHALDEMEADTIGPITRVDVVNVLRGGVVEPAEYERGPVALSGAHGSGHGGRGLSLRD